jgi:SOS response associated peptidase (SRAP)
MDVRTQVVATRRCVVPADGFYEWRREGNRKVPMWIRLKSREPFAFPGLWDCWLDHDTGTALYSFTIITTRANALLRLIHDRMPVIYDAAMGRQWLDGPFGGRAMGLDLVLQPLPSERMEAHEVSTLVNSPENESPACIQRVSPSQPISRSCLCSNRISAQLRAICTEKNVHDRLDGEYRSVLRLTFGWKARSAASFSTQSVRSFLK